MKVLITGGAGFIGSHLCDRLVKEGHTVVCIDDLSLGNKENLRQLEKNLSFTFTKQDILNKEKLNKLFSGTSFDTVFHLAANSDIQQGSKIRDIDLKRNFLTTFNILECMKEYGVKEIIFSSTSAIYGESNRLINEDYGPIFPISFYGASKLAAESYISVYSDNYGITAWMFRFPNVIGSRATHGIIYDLFNKLKKNSSKLEVLGDGTQNKPYLHVSELLDAMLFCYQHSKERLNYFNIGVDSTTTVKTIAELVAQKWGQKTDIVYRGGKRGWVGDVPYFKYDLSKIHRLGWRSKLSSEEAVKKAIDEIYQEIR